jgi:predicted small metal-binding protein
MLEFACKDIGLNCSYVAKGNTLEEVKKQAMDHAQVVHKDFLDKMTPEQKVELDKNITRMTR